MDREDILSLQRKFSKFHRLISFIIYFYCFALFYRNPKNLLAIITAATLFLFLIIEYFVLKPDGVGMKKITCLRYFQLFLLSFQLLGTHNIYSFGIVMLFMLLFAMEYFLSFDFLESYYRILYYLSTGITFLVFIFLKGFIKIELDEKLLSSFILIGVFISILFILSRFLTEYVHQNIRHIYGQARIIDDVNIANEELKNHQQRMEKSNELLGLQKVKLEAAYNEINRANSEMMIQDEIVKYISSSLEIDNLMTLITESIINKINADVCVIFLYPDTVANREDFMKYKVKTTLGTEYNNTLSQMVKDRCFDEYLKRKKVYLDNQVRRDAYFFNREGILGSFILAPLIKNAKRIGALFVGHTKYNYFSKNTAFYEVIVSQFLIALNNANMYEEMERMAILDGLTGIYNRRHLMKLFDDNLQEVMVNRVPFTVALFDIDKFKSINDTYGHSFGDVVIQAIAALAKSTAKENKGIAARYGGEEFVILFPDCRLEEAYSAVQVLHTDIQNAEMDFNGKIVHVSISLGLTSYPQTCSNPADLLNRADWAMYYAKETGRNRIVIDNNEANYMFT